MNNDKLSSVAKAIVAKQKGVLAAESMPGQWKRMNNQHDLIVIKTKTL